MKVNYIDEIESKTAWWPSMYCRNCGSHLYEIHHLFESKEKECWWIKCRECGRISPETPTKELALSAWRTHKGRW